MILLHASIKKTQQTNPTDIELAIKRLKEWKKGVLLKFEWVSFDHFGQSD